MREKWIQVVGRSGLFLVSAGAAKEREWELEGGDDGRLGVLPEGEGMQIFLGGDDSF